MRRSLWLAAGLAVAAVAAVAQQAIIKPAQVNGGVYLASPPTLSDQQSEAFLFDANGNLKVNVNAGGASGGTSSNFGSAFPATGTAIGVKSGANMVNLTADGSNNLDVNCVVGCSGGTFNNNADAVATSATNGQSAAWLYGFNGTTWDRLRVDGSKNLDVAVATSVLPTGAATSALQTTGNSTLTTINTTLGSPFQAGGALGAGSNTIGKVDVLGNAGAIMDFAGQNASSPANALLIGGQFNTSPTTITSGNVSPFQLDNAGKLLIDCSANCSLAQASTTSGQTGSLIMGAVTTAAPTYTTAQTDPLSLTTAGALRVDGSAVTQPVSLAANQSVNEAQINGVTPLMNNGTSGTGSQRINIASDNTAIANWGQGATGSAVPTGATQIGARGSGNLTTPIVCDNWKPFSISGTTSTKLVALASSKQVYICSINLVVAAASNVALIEGTKTTNECDTATAGLAGGTTAATGWNLAANGGLTQGSGFGVIMATATASHDVCIVQSASTQLSGAISWTQF